MKFQDTQGFTNLTIDGTPYDVVDGVVETFNFDHAAALQSPAFAFDPINESDGTAAALAAEAAAAPDPDTENKASPEGDGDAAADGAEGAKPAGRKSAKTKAAEAV